jgi:hypothetical protein
MSRTVVVILIYHRHKATDIINLLGLERRHNMFPVRYEHYPLCVLNKEQGDKSVKKCDG